MTSRCRIDSLLSSERDGTCAVAARAHAREIRETASWGNGQILVGHHQDLLATATLSGQIQQVTTFLYGKSGRAKQRVIAIERVRNGNGQLRGLS